MTRCHISQLCTFGALIGSRSFYVHQSINLNNDNVYFQFDQFTLLVVTNDCKLYWLEEELQIKTENFIGEFSYVGKYPNYSIRFDYCKNITDLIERSPGSVKHSINTVPVFKTSDFIKAEKLLVQDLVRHEWFIEKVNQRFDDFTKRVIKQFSSNFIKDEMSEEGRI